MTCLTYLTKSLPSDHSLTSNLQDLLQTWLKLPKEIGFKVIQNKFEHSTFIKGETYPILICIEPL